MISSLLFLLVISTWMTSNNTILIISGKWEIFIFILHEPSFRMRWLMKFSIYSNAPPTHMHACFLPNVSFPHSAPLILAFGYWFLFLSTCIIIQAHVCVRTTYNIWFSCRHFSRLFSFILCLMRMVLYWPTSILRAVCIQIIHMICIQILNAYLKTLVTFLATFFFFEWYFIYVSEMSCVTVFFRIFIPNSVPSTKFARSWTSFKVLPWHRA